MPVSSPHYLLLLSLYQLMAPNACFKAIGDLGTIERVGSSALTGCLFPERWEGTWFQSGVRQPITIEGPRLSNKGTCLGAEGDKFLVVDDKRICYRCVVIHEKHANVLQYKETFCHGRDSLPTLCSLITGDALLYSMFREGALPVPCPFRGPFTFTYNRGHGECRNPVSSIDVCTEDSRLLLSYQACPDVYGTESTVEELQCLATWKEGSSRYLVGKVHHSHATSNEDRFRCFVYEKSSGVGNQGGQGGTTSHRDRERSLLQAGLLHQSHAILDDVDYRVAQSGDATCNGLFSATEGSRTMTLRRAPSPNKCRFPGWLSSSQHWHTLDYSATYSFHHRNSTLRITNSSSGQEMKVVCAQQRHHPAGEPAPVMLVAHFTMGCQSGYICMLFYRRDSHVVEVQTGSHVRRPEDACGALHFNKTSSPFVTLVTTSPESRQCPYMGKFTISQSRSTRSLRKREHWRHILDHQEARKHQDHDANTPHEHEDHGKHEEHRPHEEKRGQRRKRVDRGNPCQNEEFSSLVIGCSSQDTMEFYSDCNSVDVISAYSCHGSWEENGTHYLITTPLSRASHGARRHCFMYRESTSGGGPEGGEITTVVHFSSSSEGCDRSLRPGREGVVVFNATSTGKCIETNHQERTEISISLLLVTLLPIFINYLLLQTR